MEIEAHNIEIWTQVGEASELSGRMTTREMVGITGEHERSSQK